MAKRPGLTGTVQSVVLGAARVVRDSVVASSKKGAGSVKKAKDAVQDVATGGGGGADQGTATNGGEPGRDEPAKAPVPRKAAAKRAAPSKRAAAARTATASEPAVAADDGHAVATRRTGAPRKKAVVGEPVAAPPVAPAVPAGSATLPFRPQEDPWTAEELDGVRAELRDELERLQQEMDSIESSIADVLRDSGDGAGDDPADSGSKAYGREQELTFLAATRENLFQTRRALERIEDATFGTCESCGGPIGKLRVQAFPRATLCVACKQAQERR